MPSTDRGVPRTETRANEEEARAGRVEGPTRRTLATRRRSRRASEPEDAPPMRERDGGDCAWGAPNHPPYRAASDRQVSTRARVRSGLRNRCHASSDRRFSCSSDQFRAAHGHRHRRRRTRGLRANDEHHPRHHTPSFASSDARSYSIRPASSSLTRRPLRHSPRPRPRPPRRPRLPAPPGRSPRGRR